MATNLYETLGISRNASPEDIRRAYRRKALETHPDRLPPGASAADKAASEDMFRKVNNAYEVLCDPQSRAAYDEHGVWPSPNLAANSPFANGPDPFSSPFFHDPFSFSRGPRMPEPFGGFGFGARPVPRGFTNPFELFDSIFGDLDRALRGDPFADVPFGRHGLGASPSGRGFFDGGFPSLMPSPFSFGGGGFGSSGMQMFSGGGNGGRWVSESWSSSTVNGTTHTKCVRKDSEGNEHVTYRYPDGTERHTVNGIEQSTSQPQRALPPSAPSAPPPVSYSQSSNMPPPPYYEAVGQPPARSHSHSSRHHGRYDNYPGDRHGHRERHRHRYSSQDRERDRGRDRHDVEQDRYSHRDDGRGHDAQNGSSWKFWRP